MGFELKKMFDRAESVSAADFDAWRRERREGEYQLLDVRQPGEYEKNHIAGAVLIPMAELPARIDELDRDIPLLVYCAVGGRSSAAARYLAGQGFSRVINLSGGIKAYQGGRVSGAWEEIPPLLADLAGVEQALPLALAMEEGLRRVYLGLADETAGDIHALLLRLAGMEAAHIARLKTMAGGDNGEIEPLEIIEGGGREERQMEFMRGHLADQAGLLDAAMAIEIAAFDLYARLAAFSIGELAALFRTLSGDERNHLEILAHRREAMA